MALDHTALLGDTIQEITTVKCGICKPPCTVISSPGQTAEALGVIMETAAARGLTVRIPNAAAAPITEEEPGRLAFVYGGRRYILRLTGSFQRDNALTALEVASCL